MKLALPRISEIIEGIKYYSVSEEYSEFYKLSFDAVRCQILKFEPRQVYREPGKAYDEAISKGDLEEAVKYIPGIVEDNTPTYNMLKSKGVVYTRCRPLKVPVTDYTKWEIAVFRETSKAYEDIFWCIYSQLDLVFDEYATHDFMVFDARMAIVQDYDESGCLQGIWFLETPEKIIQLITLFGYIKANCMPLSSLNFPKFEI